MGLTDKVAVVTGASRGIGRAVVDELLAEGVKVVAGARHVDALAGLPVVTLTVDLATADGPGRLVGAALEAFGGVDFLINNAGSATLHAGFADISDADWAFMFETNFMSAVRATRAAFPTLIERRGVVVNVSSMNAHMPEPMIAEYSALKAAMNNLTGSLARELAPHGARAISVSPGPILTDMQVGPGGAAEQAGIGIDEWVADTEEATPLGRFGTPQEVAAAIVVLLSGRLGYITGSDLPIDGGFRVR